MIKGDSDAPPVAEQLTTDDGCWTEGSLFPKGTEI